jgi:hypothetical protein
MGLSMFLPTCPLSYIEFAARWPARWIRCRCQAEQDSPHAVLWGLLFFGAYFLGSL